MKKQHHQNIRPKTQTIQIQDFQLSRKIFLEETKNPILDYQLIFDQVTKSSPFKFFRGQSETILLQKEVAYSILKETYVTDQKTSLNRENQNQDLQSVKGESDQSEESKKSTDHQTPTSDLGSTDWVYPGIFLKVISRIKLYFYRHLKKDLLFWFFEMQKKSPIFLDRVLVIFKDLFLDRPFSKFRRDYQSMKSDYWLKNKNQIAFDKLYPSLDFFDLSLETFLMKKSRVSLIKTINLSWDLI